MTNNSSASYKKESYPGANPSSFPYESFRDLLDSLSKEQKINQELITSIGFSLRSFTNLYRFLELVPLVASRLVGVDGSLLVPFHCDGRISREQLQVIPESHADQLILKIEQTWIEI